MPIDLKAPLDAVTKAREERDQVASNVAAWIAEKSGTGEMTVEALALQNESLDKAEQKYGDLLATYQKLVKTNQPSDVANLFVPANQTTSEEDKPKDVMTRKEFGALTPQERLDFAKRGGKLTE